MKNSFFNKVLIVLCLGSVVYIACNKKVLDVPPPTVSELSFFKSEAEFRKAIIGAYAGIIDYYSTGNHGGGGGGTGGSAMLEVWFKPADDVTVTAASDAFEYFDNITPGAGKLDQAFRSSYVMIGRANKVIEKLREADPAIFVTTGMRETMEGEMLFLRSLGHFMLWNLFGTAPVDTIVVKSQDQIGLPSSTGTQLLDQCIVDLTKAAAQLPTSWGTSEVGRATKNSAFGLLGKSLVFRANATNGNAADYTAAIAAFNQITGAALTANFNDNFDATKENNVESLFEFQAGKNMGGAPQNSWLSNDACDCGVAGSYFQMFYEGPSGAGGGIYRPSAKLKAAFDAADPRLPLTINPDATKNQFIRYIVGGDALDGQVNSINNIRILRYADILLLKAEAVLKSNGSKSEAIGLVNQIRARARNMVGGGTAPADFSAAETNEGVIMGWIMDERLREFAGEGVRWFDLRRWHLAKFITLNNAFFSSNSPASVKFENTQFPNKNLFFPIPLSETSRNVNIVQNEGY
ncbi:MAG: RagB/SusD family nutrient uptake outer membrane protein [Chitinophagaceae bacterium]|nr:RagB/SusD family nutrient uptake outer membrane protein [Chitinophagaceae bacterium]